MASKSKYIFSTLATSVAFAHYSDGAGDLPIQTGAIIIRGGANVPDKRMNTPVGVRTEVTEDELELLLKNDQFMGFVDRGYIKISDKDVNVEKAAADMKGRDVSAPLVPEDFEEDKAPKISSRKA